MYNFKIIKCGSRIEIYKINNYVINESKKDEGYKIVEDLLNTEEVNGKKEGKQSHKDRKATLNNARNNIIRLIKCNSDMQTFITLTFAEEQDYKESKKSLNNLFNKLRRKYKDLKYLWVLEYGELHNRLHYHLLCNIPIDIKLSTSKEKKSVDHKALENKFEKRYWKYGFVDIRQLDQEGNTNIALYIATYITKSMENRELEGYRVYGYSNKTLDKPMIEKFMDKRDIEEVLSSLIQDGYTIKFCNSYEIGYIKDGRNHVGKVNYFDLERLKNGD